jgi:hypothetical protein
MNIENVHMLDIEISIAEMKKNRAPGHDCVTLDIKAVGPVGMQRICSNGSSPVGPLAAVPH